MNAVVAAFGANKRKRNLKVTFDELVEMGWDQSTESFTSNGFAYSYDGETESDDVYINWSRTPEPDKYQIAANEADLEAWYNENKSWCNKQDPDAMMDIHTLYVMWARAGA